MTTFEYGGPEVSGVLYHVLGIDRHERSECSEERCGLWPLGRTLPGTTLPDTPLVREAVMGGSQLIDSGTIFASVPSPEPFKAQTVENLFNELCVGAEPDQPTVTQDELLTALDELLDSALHDERCYIHENDTECVCVIGKVRAALPPCGATYRPAHPQRGDRVVTCHRNAHPSSPDRHVF